MSKKTQIAETTPRFWLVWKVNGYGNHAPTVMHESFTVAENEAARLAAQNPGSQFAVLEALQIKKATAVVSTDICRTVRTKAEKRKLQNLVAPF